jgi:hypothetical protein
MALIAITILVHGYGTTLWIGYLLRHYLSADGSFLVKKRLPILIVTALVLIFLHLVEIFVWALTYRAVAPVEIESLEAAMYFSAVTFTTLGYGDITLNSEWRVLSGFEAINGILLVGWTTAFLYAVIQRTWGSTDRDSTQK